MSKFKRLSLDEARDVFPLLNEEARKALKGGCDGCSEWIDSYPGMPIYTLSEFEKKCDDGSWLGGLVCGFGYIHFQSVVYGNMGYCSRHEEYYDLSSDCYICYMDENYCDSHQVYFCYECSQPGHMFGDGDSGSGDSHSGGSSGSDSGTSGSVGGTGGGSYGYDTSGNVPEWVGRTPLSAVQTVVDNFVDSSFNEEGKLRLINDLEVMANMNKVGDFIFNTMNEKNLWMSFSIGDTILHKDGVVEGVAWNASAIYNATQNKLIFLTSEDITRQTVTEELVHAIQRSVYGNKMVYANPNYEYEAKIITDALMNCASQNFSTPESKEAYTALVNGVKKGTLNDADMSRYYRECYAGWNDPNGIKQAKKAGDLYDYDNGQNNDFDPQVLKMVLGVTSPK